MFKQLFTLARGRSANASQAFLDANALTLLRQQMREAAQGVEKSRKAVALVMAYAEREKASLIRIEEKIADLETRARAALENDSEALALEAATAIAELESERDATRKTIDTYTVEITQLRKDLSQSAALLAELKRGQRIAEATSKTQKLRGDMPTFSHSDLSDASATLRRLQDRQKHNDATMAAMTELSASASAESLSDRLAAEGFGAPKKTAASDVLERLRKSKG